MIKKFIYSLLLASSAQALTIKSTTSDEPAVQAAKYALKYGKPDKQKDTPHVEFNKPYDHMVHQKDIVDADIPRVKITTLKPGTGKTFIGIREWAIVHWKGIDESGHELRNSRNEHDKLPKAFEVGKYKVAKCWDIAIQQMKEGGIYRFNCPKDLDVGDAEIRGNVLGSSHPVSGDMTYELEILQAGMNPEMLGRLWHPRNDLKNGVCFYLVSGGRDGKGSSYAVEVAQNDKYAPRKTGVYNIGLGEWKGKASNNKFQQWKYSEADSNIVSCAHPESVLLEGSNMNLATYLKKGWKQQ